MCKLRLPFAEMFINDHTNLVETELKLVTHVEKWAFPEFKMIHSFRTFSCQNNDPKSIREGPIKKDDS